MERFNSKGEWTPGDIRRLREKLGCTQEEFAKCLGVTNVALSRWETGRSRPMGKNLFFLGALCQSLQVPGAEPSRLKRLLLIGGVLAISGIAPVALWASGLLTASFVRDRIGELFPLGEEPKDKE